MVKLFWIAVAPILLVIFLFMPIRFLFIALIPVGGMAIRHFMMRQAVGEIWDKYDRADAKKNDYHW